MKTTVYNPSELEVQFAKALENVASILESNLPGSRIIEVENSSKEDNPILKFKINDTDGDPHEIVVKVIQTPDKF
ncbi:hypothetical protein [Fulvivirga sediminis]|uniref:Uncharacterized protein n=1 Tax=Fulvivirga sediminis TaxID=2803949 RepID=A0A937JX92_9BACT|nr:hypothetical protein [Fulvivirga sediminis]MBL3655268.1 hypothetical protein [Fulvivirga sediminis]